MLFETRVDGDGLPSLIDQLSRETGFRVSPRMKSQFSKELRWAKAPLVSAHDAYSGCLADRLEAKMGRGKLAEAKDLFLVRLMTLLRNCMAFFLAAWHAGATAYFGMIDGMFGIFVVGDESEAPPNCLKLI